MHRIVLALALAACARESSVSQPLLAGPPGVPGPAGPAGAPGATGAQGAAGAFDVLDGDGQPIGRLVTVLFSGAAPVYVTWEDGRFVQRDAFGAPMRSQGVFSEDPSACAPPLFLPEDSPGRLESDTLSTYVLDAFGPRQDGLIVRAGEPRPMEMAGYLVFAPDGSATCVPVSMGPAQGIPVTLLPRARVRGPMGIRER